MISNRTNDEQNEEMKNQASMKKAMLKWGALLLASTLLALSAGCSSARPMDGGGGYNGTWG